ncbi:MAG: hypothetical protein J7496_12050 [Novosphingobium sp.]|nr:hypothetical protein [Novosphingobium sp.]
MKFARFAATVSLASIGLLLAGCGGGGVSSTPTPTPAGGGGTPTPTPTGSPTPTPAAVNEDLIAPLASESFRNYAHRASASYARDGSGISGQSEGRQGATFSFDASNNSYTISVGGRSQTFRSSDAVSTGYHHESGSAVDDLTLTPTGASGSAPLTYKYVGGAFWQHQSVGSSKIDASFDSLVYGVASKSVPLTGSAAYAIDVLGAINTDWDNIPESFTGSGGLTVDFGKDSVSADAQFIILRADGSRLSNADFDGTISLDGALASDGLSFTGGVEVRSYGIYTGTADGGFFGPDGAEVGASYSAKSSEGDVLSGVLLGAKDASLQVVPLAQLTEKTDFISAIGGGAAHLKVLSYDPATKKYTIPDFAAEPTGELVLGTSQRSASQPDSRFIEYTVTQNGHDAKVLFYRLGSDNSQVQLTYASFARVEIAPAEGSDEKPYFREILFGSRTPTELIPRSGSASYSGVLYGNGSDNVHQYRATGTASFTANFGDYHVDATLHPILTDISDGSTLDFGVHSGSGIVHLDQGTFMGTFDGDGATALVGYFYGPGAEEIGASFALRKYDSTTLDGALYVDGVAVGKKN